MHGIHIITKGFVCLFVASPMAAHFFYFLFIFVLSIWQLGWTTLFRSCHLTNQAPGVRHEPPLVVYMTEEGHLGSCLYVCLERPLWPLIFVQMLMLSLNHILIIYFILEAAILIWAIVEWVMTMEPSFGWRAWAHSSCGDEALGGCLLASLSFLSPQPSLSLLTLTLHSI